MDVFYFIQIRKLVLIKIDLKYIRQMEFFYGLVQFLVSLKDGW